MRKTRMTLALGLILMSGTAFGSVPKIDALDAVHSGTGSASQIPTADGLIDSGSTDVCEAPRVGIQDACTDRGRIAEGAANQTLDDSTSCETGSDSTGGVLVAQVTKIADEICVVGEWVCTTTCAPCAVLPGECCSTRCWCAPTL